MIGRGYDKLLKIISDEDSYLKDEKLANLCSVILCTGDHLWRQAVRAVLETGRIVILGEPTGEKETLRLLEQLRPKVAIIDSFIAFQDGKDSLHRLVRSCKSTHIVLIAAKPTYMHVVNAIDAGVTAFIAKSDCSDLLRSFHREPEPRLYLSPAVVRALEEGRAHGSYTEELLSHRERQVLQLVAEGCTTKRIASHLCISPKTVESHVMRVKKKLNTRETAGLVRYALENGLARVQ